MSSWSTYSKKQYPLEKLVPLSFTRLNAFSSPNDDSNSFTYRRERNTHHDAHTHRERDTSLYPLNKRCSYKTHISGYQTLNITSPVLNDRTLFLPYFSLMDLHSSRITEVLHTKVFCNSCPASSKAVSSHKVLLLITNTTTRPHSICSSLLTVLLTEQAITQDTTYTAQILHEHICSCHGDTDMLTRP